jgi:hypothetical protein
VNPTPAVDAPRCRFRVSRAVAKTRYGRFVTVPPGLFEAILELCPRDDRVSVRVTPARRTPRRERIRPGPVARSQLPDNAYLETRKISKPSRVELIGVFARDHGFSSCG